MTPFAPGLARPALRWSVGDDEVAGGGAGIGFGADGFQRHGVVNIDFPLGGFLEHLALLIHSRD